MRDLWQNEDGVVPPLVAVSGIALIGFAALALDVGYWYGRSTKMSNVADAAAISGAKIAVPTDLDNLSAGAVQWRTDRKADIVTLANANLDIDALEDNAVTSASISFGCWKGDAYNSGNCVASSPPVPGELTGAANAVKVVSTHLGNAAPDVFFAKVFPDVANFDIPRTAVAFRKMNKKACLITLSDCDGTGTQSCKPADYSMSITGNVTLSMVDCGIQVNGYIGGSGEGSMNLNDIPYFCANDGAKSGLVESLSSYVGYCGEISDPYTSLPTYTSGKNDGTPLDGSVTTLSSGTYKGFNGGQSFNNDLTLSGGVYVINGGSFSTKGNLTGSGVTIILTNGAQFDIGGGGNVSLTAPANTGSVNDGFVIIQNDNADYSKSDRSSLGGNSSINITGTIYLKDAPLNLHGTPTASTLSTSIVVDKLSMEGNANWSNVSFNPGANGPLLPTRVHLVQ